MASLSVFSLESQCPASLACIGPVGPFQSFLLTISCSPIPPLPLSASTDRRPAHSQIKDGKDVYLVKQLTGHSFEILVCHCDRSKIKKRSAEATARTYAKKKQNDKSIDL